MKANFYIISITLLVAISHRSTAQIINDGAHIIFSNGAHIVAQDKIINDNVGVIEGIGYIDASNGLEDFGSILSPGLPIGTLTHTGSYVSDTSSILKIELNGTTPDDLYDQLMIAGAADISGTIDLYLNFAPGAADVFDIVTANSISETLPETVTADFGGTVYIFDVINTDTTIRLQNASTLPVELLDFEVVQSGTDALLTWHTASEINNDYFDVEHSSDGLYFDPIGQVDGHGTTATKQSYDYVDKTPQHGLNYYRLRQVDFNGDDAYSVIRSIYFDGSQNNQRYLLRYFPNPTQDVLMITSNHDLHDHFIRLVDVFGREIIYLNYHDGMSIHLEAYPDGIYYVQFLDDKGVVISSESVMKVRQ